MGILKIAPSLHVLAIVTGVLLFTATHLVNLSPVLGCFNGRYLTGFSTNWPGIEELDKHDVFNPAYRNKKKIVFLGGSNTEAVGCDKSWSNKVEGLERNAHLSCSIAGHLEQLLQMRGHDEWKVFNLGRNNGDVISNIATFIRLMKLRPDIVILGADGWIFRLSKDGIKLGTVRQMMVLGGAPEHMLAKFDAILNEVHEILPEGQLEIGGKSYSSIDPISCNDSVTLSDFLTAAYTTLRRKISRDYPPRVPELFPYPYEGSTIDGYSVRDDLVKKGVKVELTKLLPVFNDLVTWSGGHLLVYQPYSATRAHKYVDWKEQFEDQLVDVVRSSGIDYFDLLRMPLTPILDDYDAVHLTYYGNLKTAEELYDRLQQRF